MIFSQARLLRAGDNIVISGACQGSLAAILAVAALLVLPLSAHANSSGALAASNVDLPLGYERTDNVLYAFVPNDPYYATGNPLGSSGQWHLDKQTSGSLVDSNVVGAWNRNLTGQGVVVGMVDDGLQRTHPDLAPNYDAADSFDFGQNDADPSPVYPNTFGPLVYGDNHGTSTAGIVAARGGNAIGGTGAAPHASVAGLRIDFGSQTVQQFVDATLYHSSGNNTSIKIKNHSYGVPFSYVPQVPEGNAVVTSHNAGTIHVFAVGNERSEHGFYVDVDNNNAFTPDVDYAVDGDANKKYLPSLQETIDVAALSSTGIFSDYSNWGANIWVTAPSNSFRAGELRNIITTDRTGGVNATGGYNYVGNASDNDLFTDVDYNSIFGGTSASTALVSGILALAKEAQPALNTRFAKHLLARTSVVVDPLDVSATGGWVTNGAGLKFNENYGFGLIDADALTAKAVQYSGVTPLVVETKALTTVNQVIPDNTPAGVDRIFHLNGTQPLEEVEIHLNIDHPYCGDLEAYLTSPAGTISRLMINNPADSFDDIDWTFLSNAFWGEIPAGDWKLNVRDVFIGDQGVWSSYNVLAKMGSLIPVPEPATWTLAAIGLVLISNRRRRGN